MVGLRASHIVRDDMNSDSFKRSPMLMVEHKKNENDIQYTHTTQYMCVCMLDEGKKCRIWTLLLTFFSTYTDSKEAQQAACQYSNMHCSFVLALFRKIVSSDNGIFPWIKRKQHKKTFFSVRCSSIEIGQSILCCSSRPEYNDIPHCLLLSCLDVKHKMFNKTIRPPNVMALWIVWHRVKVVD